MKVLLTGAPGSGKTTSLTRFLDQVRNKQGFLTHELLENGVRTGFQSMSSNSHSVVLASVYSNSGARVSRYGVEVADFEHFLNMLPRVEPGTLLYIDEIGQMELFSARFKALVDQYLSLSNPFIGTIKVFEDDFVKKILSRRDILFIEVTPHNRDYVNSVLQSLAGGIFFLNDLGPDMQKAAIDMAKDYFDNKQYLQLNKLFGNAVKYVAESRVSQSGPTAYLVKGYNRDHKVDSSVENMKCDCDLFNGRGDFEGRAGDCSHIQAVKLMKVDG